MRHIFLMNYLHCHFSSPWCLSKYNANWHKGCGERPGKRKKGFLWVNEHFRTTTMFWHLNDFFVSFNDLNVSYDFSFFCYTL